MNLEEAKAYKQQLVKAKEDFNLHVIGAIKQAIAEDSGSVQMPFDDWDGPRDYYMDEIDAEKLRSMGYRVEHRPDIHVYQISGW